MIARDDDGPYCLYDGWRQTTTLQLLDFDNPDTEDRRRRRQPKHGAYRL